MNIISNLSQYPRLKIFEPLLYHVHEDQIVSTEEFTIVNDYFNELTWPLPEERECLAEMVQPGNFIHGELSHLRSEVRYSLVKDKVLPTAGMIDLGTFLIDSRQEDWVKESLALQDKLGFLNHEALYHFYPEWRHSHSSDVSDKTSFNVQRLQSILDGDQSGLIKEIKSLIEEGTFELHHRHDLNSFREEILLSVKILAAKGYGSLGYPSEYGGCGDMASYFTVMEVISMLDLSITIKYGVQFGLFGGSIMNLGTKKHYEKFLNDIGTLKLAGCFAMTETGHGSNVKGIQTIALYDHPSRTFTIHTPHIQAQKDYIGNAALHGKFATVFAKLIIDKTDYGVAAFLVPLRNELGETMPGVTIKDCGYKMGLNGVDNGRISFDHVTVPYDALLDKYLSINENGVFQSDLQSENKRFFTMLGTLVGGRIGIPRSALTASKVGLATAVRYGHKRKQFGPDGEPEVPVLNYRIHQRRLLPLVAKSYALHFALRYITQRYLHKKESEAQEIEAIAAGLKAYTTWFNTQTLQTCREACGGQGYLSENRIDDLKNDSDVYTTFEGDNTVLMQLVAKSRLIEFKQSFHQIGFTGYIRYFATKAATSVSQKNPFIIRSIDEDHLHDYDFHINAFRYREQDQVESVAKRLKRLMDDGMDSFDAANVCQQHLIQAAEAYIERIVLEQFYTAIQSVSDEGCKQILIKLCRLYALQTIEHHRAWYLETEYLAPAKTKAIRKWVNQLCWDLRNEAVALVDAYGIIESCLGEIGKKINT